MSSESTPAAGAGVSDEFVAIVKVLRDMRLNDSSLDVLEHRAMLDLDVQPPPTTSVEAIDAGGVPAEWVIAEGASTHRVVMHLHGGAYTAGGVGSHRGMAASLSAAAGCAVLVVDYRLAPESPFPAAVDDARAAYGWLLGPANHLDPASVVISGDSAGGGLTTSLLIRLRDEGAPQPAGAVLLSPWTDLSMSGASHLTEADHDPMCSTAGLAKSVAAYVPDGIDPADPRVSPLFAELAGLPPLLIHVGEAEILRDDAVGLAERVSAAGGDVELLVAPEMVHVWHTFAGMVPESTRDLQAAADWIAARQRGGETS